MTIFSKLFGIRSSTPDIAEQSPEAPQIDKNIFLEERHPMDIHDEKSEKQSKEAPLLQYLLDEDYFAMGQRDGYEAHDLRKIEEGVELIKARFKIGYEKCLIKIEAEMDAMGVFMHAEIEEQMAEQYDLLHVKYTSLEKQQKTLINQKDLVLVGEGYVEEPLLQYQAGFKRGYALYVEEKVLSYTIRLFES